MPRSPLAAILFFGAAIVTYAQPASINSASFRTNAQFSKDSDHLQFSTAVAIIGETRGNFTSLELSFYTFLLSAGDVTSVMKGSLAPLERRREQSTSSARERNRSVARIGIVLTSDREVWNASLGFPGITCTIVVSKEDTSKAFQEFSFDGRQLVVRGKGTRACDMTGIGMSNHELGWDIDVNVPVFAKK